MVRRKQSWVTPQTALRNAPSAPKKAKRQSTRQLAEEAARDAAEAAEAMGHKTRRTGRVEKPQKPTVTGPTKRVRKGQTKPPKLSGGDKLIQECEDAAFQITPEGQQMLEILETYTKAHLVTTEPFVLRELLRSAHKCMPAGPPKSKLRGILAYYTRTPIMATWSKVSQILTAVAAQEKITTFERELDVSCDRIVDETTILRVRANPLLADRIEVLDTKIKALKRVNPKNPIIKRKGKKATITKAAVNMEMEDSEEEGPSLPDLESLNNTSQSIKDLFGESNLSY